MLDEVFSLNETRVPAVSLENNRLSGNIPSYFQTVEDISILGSNVFSCGLNREDLPQRDSSSSNYECASVAFDIPYYVWLSLSVVVLLTAAVVMKYWESGREAAAALQQWWKVFENDKVKNRVYIIRVNHYVDLLCSTAGWGAVYILTLLLPIYLITAYFYGTFTHQYAWVAPAAFSSGTTTFALEFPLLILFLATVGAVFTVKLASATSGGSGRTTISDSVNTSSLRSMKEWTVFAITTLYITVNIIVVVGVNAVFVYVAIYENSA